MPRNSILLLLTIVVSLLTMSFRCGKEYIEPLPPEHNFEVPVDIFPLKKTYSLNDTIWLETDITAKELFDLKTNQTITADTGKINFRLIFQEFGTYITNPSNGFCDVITAAGVNINRVTTSWETYGSVSNFGCGVSSYRCRIGFKPNYKGAYSLNLENEMAFESCSNKIIPYHSSISFKYKAADLNIDTFNALPKNDKGGDEGINFYTKRINDKKMFVFKVE